MLHVFLSFFLSSLLRLSIVPSIHRQAKTPDLHVNSQSARNMHYHVLPFNPTDQPKPIISYNSTRVSHTSHQSVTAPKTGEMPYTQLQILNYLTATKRLKNNVLTPPTSPDCDQQKHQRLRIPRKTTPHTECRLILELREQKKKGARKGSGRPLLVFKTVGRNKSVRACGLGSCKICGRFLGKFPLPLPLV